MKRLWAPKQEDDPTPPAANAGMPALPVAADAIGASTSSSAESAEGEQPTYEPVTEFTSLAPQARRLVARPATYSEAKPVELRAALAFAQTARLAPLRLVEEVVAAAQEPATERDEPAGPSLIDDGAEQQALSPREALLRAARLSNTSADAEPQADSAPVISIDQGRKQPEAENEDDLWSAPAEPLPTLAEAAADEEKKRAAAPAGPKPLQFAAASEEGKDKDSDDEAFADFGIPPRTEKQRKPRRRPSRSLQAVEKVLLSRRFTQALVASIVLVFISNMDVPWRDWAAERFQQVKEPIARAMNSMSKPVRERAAFFVVDDFAGGIESWSTGNGSVRSYTDGTMLVRGLALREDTMNRTSYRMDFDAKIQSRAVGWVVRANSSDTYYALKLVRSNAGHFLERYPVLGGKRGAGYKRVSLPKELAMAGDFINVSSRVRDNQITTLVNGWGVDFWKDDVLDRGGVGFLAEGRESSLVRDLRISGNEDTWGLILYGTLETMRSVEDVFSSSTPATIMIAPVPLEMLAGRQASTPR